MGIVAGGVLWASSSFVSTTLVFFSWLVEGSSGFVDMDLYCCGDWIKTDLVSDSHQYLGTFEGEGARGSSSNIICKGIVQSQSMRHKNSPRTGHGQSVNDSHMVDIMAEYLLLPPSCVPPSVIAWHQFLWKLECLRTIPNLSGAVSDHPRLFRANPDQAIKQMLNSVIHILPSTRPRLFQDFLPAPWAMFKCSDDCSGTIGASLMPHGWK